MEREPDTRQFLYPSQDKETVSCPKVLTEKENLQNYLVYFEHRGQSKPLLVEMMDNFFNNILSSERMSKARHVAKLFCIFKGKMGDFRETLTSIVVLHLKKLKKIFFKLVIARVAAVDNQVFPPEQFGFRRHLRIRNDIHALQSDIERTLSNPKR